MTYNNNLTQQSQGFVIQFVSKWPRSKRTHCLELLSTGSLEYKIQKSMQAYIVYGQI